MQLLPTLTFWGALSYYFCLPHFDIVQKGLGGRSQTLADPSGTSTASFPARMATLSPPVLIRTKRQATAFKQNLPDSG